MDQLLSLPKRYERLRDAAKERDADLTRIVRKIPTATARVEELVRQVLTSRMGRFELLLGKSGSGKTTFLSTLPRFYDGAIVSPISADVELLNIPGRIREMRKYDAGAQIFVLLDRDNLRVPEEDCRDFFEGLRRLFRTKEGEVLCLWPITDEISAKQLQHTAWEIGRDSIVDHANRGLHDFKGLEKSEYFDVADVTTRSLNGGQGLEAFGLGEKVSRPLIQHSDTISEFFGHLEGKSQEINNRFGDTLKERRIPSVWILIGGDDTRELGLTVANLTQGTEKRVDIDRLIAILDDPDSKTAYLNDWRQRRDEIAFLMRRLDVRLFELPPNVALASVRAFGDDSLKGRLKRSYESRTQAAQAVRNSRFFQAMALLPSSTAATIRQAKAETASEYKRIQAVASKNDKPLNKALADAVQAGLDEEGIGATVTAERKALDEQSALQPDVMVEFADGRLVCLEPTWRTSGEEIPGEMERQQSSMTVGHAQQYLLSKVLEYVKDLGL